MMDKIMTLLVGLLIALGGWSLSRTFELSTVQAVQEDKVNRLERHVDKLQNHWIKVRRNSVRDISYMKTKHGRYPHIIIIFT